MKTANIYFNYAAKTSVGHLEVDDDADIEQMVRDWIAQGYCKIRLHGSTQSSQWIYVSWAAVVYIRMD